ELLELLKNISLRILESEETKNINLLYDDPPNELNSPNKLLTDDGFNVNMRAFYLTANSTQSCFLSQLISTYSMLTAQEQ
ncbi:hypothetical protein L9F63_018087, partial [Diploptera punctata]